MTDLVDTDLGIDLDCLHDADELDRYTSGIDLLRQDIIHRITCPRGQLIGEPDYGLDVSALLSKGMLPREKSALPGQLESEIRKDPRIETVEVTLDAVSDGMGGERWTLEVSGTSLYGPFDLIASITEAGELVIND